MLMDSQPGGMVASLEKSGNGYLTKGEGYLPTRKRNNLTVASTIASGFVMP